MTDSSEPIFPSQQLNAQGLPMSQGCAGITQRAWFAGRALPALIQVFGYESEQAAREACVYADALLKELDK